MKRASQRARGILSDRTGDRVSSFPGRVVHDFSSFPDPNRTGRSFACAVALLAIILLPALPTGAAAGPRTVRADGLSILPGPGADLACVTLRSPGFVRAVRLRVYDGKAKREVQLGKAAVTPSGNGTELQYGPVRSGVSIRLQIEPRGRCIVWRVRCRNSQDTEQWLELGPEIVLNSARGLRYFDGLHDDRSVPATADGTVEVHDLRQMLPVSAIWSPRVAISVGMAPGVVPSYLRHEYRPADPPVLASYTRVVVGADSMVETAFITCVTPGEWGKFEVLEAYYDSFPDWFRPTPGIDPRVLRAPSEYRAFPTRSWSPEICRRLWAGWEWCYAPFRRTGDIVGRPEFWDYKPARPFGKTRGMSRDKFLAWRRKAFADGDRKCNVAMLFYVPSQVWCEEQLAREQYPDALSTDPAVKNYFDTPWVTHHDNEVRVFPYGTSYERRSRADIAAVARDLDLVGFAFDTAGGTARYRGPALPKLEGRAWDDDGVYCAENVAVARLMDYVHSLRGRGRPLAVVANIGTAVYTSCLHCDAAMYEGEPWKGSRTRADILRWKMGRKPCVWWESYGLEHLIDVQSATADNVRAVLRGLADFTLLQSLRVGLLPPPNFTQGVRRLVRWMPAMLECVQTGWEPVPALRTPQPLWATRYGRGVRTLLAVAHETGIPVNADVRVENSRISEGVLLFAPYGNGKMRNRVQSGETILSLHVPVRTPLLLRAVCELRGNLDTGAVDASWARSSIRAILKLRLAAVRTKGDLRVFLPVPSDMILRGVTVDGRTVHTQVRNQVAELALKSPVGPGSVRTLVAEFAVPLFRCTEEDILDFPFVRGGAPECEVLVPDGGSERIQLAAWRIQEYFRYWFGRIETPHRKVLIPIRADRGGNPGPVRPRVLLRVMPGKPASIVRHGSVLEIAAPDAPSLDQAVLRLLRVLDVRYDSPDFLPATALFRRLGLADTVLEPK